MKRLIQVAAFFACALGCRAIDAARRDSVMLKAEGVNVATGLSAKANTGADVAIEVPADAVRAPLELGVRADCSERPFGFDEAKRAAESSTGIESFLKRIPPHAMQTFTLVYDSRAPMKADVSTQWPRVIRMNRDGT